MGRACRLRGHWRCPGEGDTQCPRWPWQHVLRGRAWHKGSLTPGGQGGTRRGRRANEPPARAEGSDVPAPGHAPGRPAVRSRPPCLRPPGGDSGSSSALHDTRPLTGRCPRERPAARARHPAEPGAGGRVGDSQRVTRGKAARTARPAGSFCPTGPPLITSLRFHDNPEERARLPASSK